MKENGVKEIATYEHPGSYVVVPVPVRNRIMARLNKAEGRVAELEQAVDIEALTTVMQEQQRLRQRIAALEGELEEARPIVEAATKQYETAGVGHGAYVWWLREDFQAAAIELHRLVDAATRAAAKEEE